MRERKYNSRIEFIWRFDVEGTTYNFAGLLSSDEKAWLYAEIQQKLIFFNSNY